MKDLYLFNKISENEEETSMKGEAFGPVVKPAVKQPTFHLSIPRFEPWHRLLAPASASTDPGK